ncbi:hydroxyethylthiazole kinase [Kocuria palustris]|uniref:hydroxyethylthiazole kinase n=1 Tax=Kocuria palustris TaxID=71999 RepID=UPI0021A37AFF|nr:hydroxyethylthiazole kinase [Kocuria palustris]MCT1590187.1 hydroxyethylthiazole kinase [Kocuria palustris]
MHSHTQSPSQSAHQPVSERMARLLEQLRSTRPLVQCLTNTVVSNFTANALLALGAAPAMTDIQGEAGPFAEVADGMLINLGTPDPEQRGAMREATAARQASGRPWVLDPVAIGSLPIRTALAAELLESRPAVIRGNPSEVLALTGGAGGRGVDTTDAPEAAVQAARQLVSTGCADAVAISGPVDLIVSASGTLRVPHGHGLLTQVVGGGCALGSVIAAFAAVAQDPAEAAAAGSLVWGLAAEDAADRCQGPGSFAVHLLDALAGLRPEDLAERCRVEAADASNAADGAAAGAGQAEEAGR